jgi:exopolyphosphatase/guanosine-5'-triphosphate,3'-diphosphate pyrophosphatase
VAQYSAVATEVFRKASNGDEYLARVRNVLPGQVKILSQDDEARLGFSTGVALANYKAVKPVEAGLDTVVWDSGGGSFQMTTVSTGGVLDTYMGSIGAIRSYKLLVENVRGQDVAESSVKSSANPVTRIEVEQLMSAIMSELTEAPAWLRDVQVLAIGGPNSIFQLATVVIESIEGKRPSSLTLQNVRLALEHCCGKADDELRFASSYPHADPASLLLPKLCLLLSVMRKTSIRNVTPILCIGSCAGLITSEDYWATS